MIVTRIDPPAWAPAYERHVVEADGPDAERARTLAAPHLPAIWAELHGQIDAFVNDPERCLLHEAEGFPLRERVTGEYYIGTETYHGYPADRDGAGASYELSIVARCLEHEWHPSQRQSGYDYLGLEAIVNIHPDGSGYWFDDGLTISAI